MSNAVLAAPFLVFASGLSAQEEKEKATLPAPPFFGAEYTLSHLGVPESLRDNVPGGR